MESRSIVVSIKNKKAITKLCMLQMTMSCWREGESIKLNHHHFHIHVPLFLELLSVCVCV